MRISLGLPTHRVDRPEEFVTGAAVTEMAQGAEAAGFDAVYVTEHPFPPDAWMETGGHHALDPFVALAFAAAATRRVRLQTNLCVIPYRNPFLTAKAVASLDALSGGRVILGVATGYLEGEFAALGVDFSERNELTDEALDLMKSAWSGATVEGDGRHFRVGGNTMLPRPLQRPHPPIWVGGNSRKAIRRAVERADGWVPMPNAASTALRRHSPALETLDDLKARIGYARSHAESVGRKEPLTVAFSLGGLAGGGGPGDDGLVSLAEQLAEAGVSYLYGGVGQAETRAEFTAEVARMGRSLVPRLAEIPAPTG
ncbi:MAG TPA: TIGR03619 family F420-dependent LLM class oxidoreductase [Acidimicrobiales bacterium]|nr:TIGR03619 family F420-dependent LLM class oxidoreductase [Acidimicrobiales bacterium]